MSKNPVILVGGNHYNGLALVRAFARYQIEAYGIIIGEDAADGFLKDSGCWTRTWFIKEDEELIPCLKRIVPGFSKKPVVIAWSDGAAAEIDRHLDELKEICILPSIDMEQGRLFSAMDKESQIGFAGSCDLKTARSFAVELPAADLPSDIPFPCIGKPIVSCEGDKKDIRKLESEEELKEYLDFLSEKGYERILLQEYLNIETEYDIQGYCHEDKSAFLVTQKVRVWPRVGGPTSYSFTIDEPQLNRIAEKIVGRLQEIRYSGLFDVDVFYAGGQFYFNEINWRSSALGYIAARAGLYYPVLWYCSVTGTVIEALQREQVVYGLYSMNEFKDIFHVFSGDLSLPEWTRQYRQCKGFAYKSAQDPKPARKKMSGAFLRKIRKLIP